MKDKGQLLSLIESEIKAKLSQGERLDLAELLKEILNSIMVEERELFLSKKDSSGNKANGYYPRTLATPLGTLELDVPKDRKNDFRPYILPEKWRRVEDSYDRLLSALKTKELKEKMAVIYRLSMFNQR
jgi:transposase-like protein